MTAATISKKMRLGDAVLAVVQEDYAEIAAGVCDRGYSRSRR